MAITTGKVNITSMIKENQNQFSLQALMQRFNSSTGFQLKNFRLLLGSTAILFINSIIQDRSGLTLVWLCATFSYDLTEVRKKAYEITNTLGRIISISVRTKKFYEGKCLFIALIEFQNLLSSFPPITS